MEKNNMAKVVTFGEIMVRLAAPEYLKLIQTNAFEISYAGAEANVAVSLAHYGIQTDYITCLPNNPIAERCIMELRGHNVGEIILFVMENVWEYYILKMEAIHAHLKYIMIVKIHHLQQYSKIVLTGMTYYMMLIGSIGQE